MKRCEFGSNPRWARRKESRPQELLDAALEVFGEKGFAGAKLDEVAKKAGVAKGTVYLYYPNKEELLKSVVREHVSPIVKEVSLAQQSKGHASSADQIADAIDQWWTRYGSTRLSAITKIILTETNAFPDIGRFFHGEVIQPWWDYLEGILKRGVDQGEFSPIDTEYVAKILCAPLVTLGVWKRTMDLCCDTHTDANRYLNTYTKLVLSGLLAGKGQTPCLQNSDNNKSFMTTVEEMGLFQPQK